MIGSFLRAPVDSSAVSGPDRLPIGCRTLDELLGGGLETGTVSLVYGPPGAGKTNLGLSAAVTTAVAGNRAMIIDTEGISPDRLDQVIPGSSSDDRDAVASRIVVRAAHDFDGQAAAVKDAKAVAASLRLIVFDSLTGFYRLERTADERDGDALRDVTRQVTHLLSLARRHDLAVLATNQVFTDPETDRVRALGGHTLEHWAGAVVRLDRFRGGNRRATLEKHRSLPAGDTAGFEITDRGLDPVEHLG